jgi:26S proteasome regulatory subunit T5
MSAQEPPNGPSVPKPDALSSSSEATPLLADLGDTHMETAPEQPPEETWEDIPEDVRSGTVEEIQTRARLIENDIKVQLWTLPSRIRSKP